MTNQRKPESEYDKEAQYLTCLRMGSDAQGNQSSVCSEYTRRQSLNAMDAAYGEYESHSGRAACQPMGRSSMQTGI